MLVPSSPIVLPDRAGGLRASERCFVIESGRRSSASPPGEPAAASTVTATDLGFDEYDVASQSWSPITTGWPTASSRRCAPFRYVWPSELDLMARLAGMTLRERWSDWNRAPFTNDSTMHVSVWEKTA